MKFSKQIKSLDRHIAPYRKKYSIINKLYNHISEINVINSFHSKDKDQLVKEANISLEGLLAPTKVVSDSTDVPKIIWMFWDSGYENAPEVIKLSVKSWQEMNPDYEVKLLCDDNLEEHLGFDFYAMYQLSTIRLFPATKADLLRLHLLSKHGGVWADTTTFCLTPLSEWLTSSMEYCGLFTFKNKYHPTRPIEAWFIASPKGNVIINNVLQRFVEYLFKERDVSLFISGKVKLVAKVTENKDESLDYSAILRAEKLGFMPYFSIGYFFYEVLRQNLSDEQLELFLRTDKATVMTNNHAVTHNDFDVFKASVVSKQTYTKNYIESESYQKRRDFLLNKLNA
ncbi:capsular polysaccharide synthesis protein [Aliivibrio sp. SR45-2]|uniref:capsular polysaccharide synthesis protein n=1 Tax=Aliivibrio sp. SR45-2 TaxID=2760931 RepID=UPI0015F78EAA|nr:capsular polysaccharide synthesis protein [Aliivibrio sp. SR45-2]MBB1313707.1 hypothetical protein [Aliivibrio sp. SR45-2]